MRLIVRDVCVLIHLLLVLVRPPEAEEILMLPGDKVDGRIL